MPVLFFFRSGKVDDIPKAPPLLYALQVYLAGSVIIQNGGNAAVQVVGELNTPGNQEIRELPQRKTGVSPVIRTGNQHIMQGTDLADGNALCILIRTHVHPVAVLFLRIAVHTLVILHRLTVFHEDRTEGEDIHDFFSFKGEGIIQISGLRGMDSVKITVLIDDEQIHAVVSLVIQPAFDQLPLAEYDAEVVLFLLGAP